VEIIPPPFDDISTAFVSVFELDLYLMEIVEVVEIFPLTME
jgi:hypothetical protein